jgi:hypothetical protein
MTSPRYSARRKMDSKQSIFQPKKTDRRLLSIGIKAGLRIEKVCFFKVNSNRNTEEVLWKRYPRNKRKSGSCSKLCYKRY